MRKTGMHLFLTPMCYSSIHEMNTNTVLGHLNMRSHLRHRSFREFPAYVNQHLNQHKHKKIAMFCTGGIRCEKSTNYLLKQGFENVFHLNGGILKYLEEVPENQSLWEGECFVFDGRVFC